MVTVKTPPIDPTGGEILSIPIFCKGMMHMSYKRTRKLMSAAMFAALIMIATFAHIPTGINSGYIHLGDSLIFLAASMLSLPYAVCAAAVGGSLADLLSGAAVWAPATFIIKSLNVLPFYLLRRKNSKLMGKGAAVAAPASGMITIAGYFIAESLMYSPQSAVVSIPFSIVQAVGSAVVFFVIAYAMDMSGAADKIRR